MSCRSRHRALSKTSTMPVKPWLRQQRAVKSALRRAAGMHALDHGAVLRGHQAGRLRAGDAERVHGLLRRRGRGARAAPGRGGEHADGGAGMPALADMLRAHAEADARPDLVAGDGGGEEIAAGKLWRGFRRPRSAPAASPRRHAARLRCTSSSSKLCTSVPLTSAACGAERRLAVPQIAGGARRVELVEGLPQDAAPFEIGAVDGAAERIEDQQLDAREDIGRNLIVGQPRDEFGDASRVDVVRIPVVRHCSHTYLALHEMGRCAVMD